MKKILISSEIVGLYKNSRHDIAHALAEWAGMLNYKYCSMMLSIPLKQTTERVEYEIPDDIFEQLQANFGRLNSIDTASEIILWSNYFMGMNL